MKRFFRRLLIAVATLTVVAGAAAYLVLSSSLPGGE